MTPRQVALLAKENNATLNLLNGNFNEGCSQNAVLDAIRLYRIQRWALITGIVGGLMTICAALHIALLLIGAAIFTLSMILVIHSREREFNHVKEFCESVTRVERVITIGRLDKVSSSSGRWYMGTRQAERELAIRLEQNLMDEARKIADVQAVTWKKKQGLEMRNAFSEQLCLLNSLIGVSERVDYYMPKN